MPTTLSFTKSLVPISQYNKGQASRIFDRLNHEDQLIVLKNNQPTAFILSPAEYERLSEVEEDYFLLMEALERLDKNGDEPGLSRDEIMAEFGITQADLDAVGDVEIE